MILVFFWLSAVLLVFSGAVHVAALCGCDMFTAFPSLWVLHLLIFVVFIPAIYCAKRFGGDKKDKDDGAKLLAAAPLWIKTLVVILLVHAMVSCILAGIQREGGQANQLEDGSFALTSHERFLRELTEEEYHRLRSYEARAASGIWMAFYSVFMMLFIDARRMKQGIRVGEPAEREAKTPARPDEERPSQGPAVARGRPPSLCGAIVSTAAAVGLVLMLRSHRYELGATASLVSIMLGVLHLRRQVGKKQQELCETMVGCFCVFPCFILAIVMTWYLQWFTYMAIASGPGPAITGAVRIVPSKDGPHTLTTGEVVDRRLLTGIGFVVWPIGVLLGGLGLVYLADVVGRYVESRRWRKPREPCPNCGAPLPRGRRRWCSKCGADWHVRLGSRERRNSE